MLSGLKPHGIRANDLADMCHDPAFAAHVASFEGFHFVETPNQQRARAIMGDHFFNPDEVRRLCKTSYCNEAYDALAEVPFSDTTLQECKDTHILFPGSSFNILSAQIRCRGLFRPLGNTRFESFARDEMAEQRWYLMRFVYEATEGSFEEKHSRLRRDEEVPLAVEVVFLQLLWMQARHQHLIEGIRLLCDDYVQLGEHVTSNGRVFVQKDKGKRGLYFGKFDPKNDRTPSAIAAVRKF